jgi:uncharacterized protein YjiS (DUF1127 family)
MNMAILPIMAHAAHSVQSAQPNGDNKPAFAQPPQARVEPLHPMFGRLLRLAERAAQTRSTQELRKYVLAVWSRLLGWHMRRTTRQILNSLDNHTLADIGLRRGDIDTLLREMAERKARWYVNQ